MPGDALISDLTLPPNAAIPELPTSKVSRISTPGFEPTSLRALANRAAAALQVAVIVLHPAIARADETPGEASNATPRVFARGLERPEAVVPISGDAALVAERSGRVLLLDGSTRSDLGTIAVPGSTVFYVPERPYTEGLKDLIVAPGQPGTFYWCMTTGTTEAIRWTVGRTRIETGRGQPSMANEVVWQSEPQPWTRSSPPPFSGCRLAAEGDGIIVAMGANGRAAAGGRIMRISASNAHQPQVLSTGHRNQSGLALMSGTLWEVEHGPKGGDEVNIIVPGGDYGWPAVSSGDPDDQEHQGFLRTRPGSIDPVTTWTPAIAPSSMTGRNEKLYIGMLRGGVIELTVNGTTVMSQKRVLQTSERVRDVRAGPGPAMLWVLTDGPNASLLQLAPAP